MNSRLSFEPTTLLLPAEFINRSRVVTAACLTLARQQAPGAICNRRPTVRRIAERHRVHRQPAVKAAVVISNKSTCAPLDAARSKLNWPGAEQGLISGRSLHGTSSPPASKQPCGPALNAAGREHRLEVHLELRNHQTVSAAVNNVDQNSDAEVKLWIVLGAVRKLEWARPKKPGPFVLFC